MENIKQKTAAEIIDETVEFYSNKPRSINSQGFCLYKGPNNTECAFARLVLEDKKYLLSEGETADAIIAFNDDKELLKPEYRGQKKEFYRALQILHDYPGYWEGRKLTTTGQAYVKTLKQRYANTDAKES